MKKISVIFLALALVIVSLFTLSSCGDHEGGRSVDIDYGFEKLNETIKDTDQTRKDVLLNDYNSYEYLEVVIKDYVENTTETIYIHNNVTNNLDLLIFIKTERLTPQGKYENITETTFELYQLNKNVNGEYFYCHSTQIPGSEPSKSDAVIKNKEDFDSVLTEIFSRVYRAELLPNNVDQITAAYKNSLSFNTGKVQTITLEFNGKRGTEDAFIATRFNYTTNKIHDVKIKTEEGGDLLETIEYRYPGNAVSDPKEIDYSVFKFDHECFGGTATCTEKAICANCGKAYGEPDSSHHTNEEIIPAVAATCTETGLTEGKRCTACGITTVEQTTVAALGHDHSDGAVVCKICEARAIVTDLTTFKSMLENEKIKDIIISETLLVESEVEINLNGKTISIPQGTLGDGVFHVISGGKLIINGNGTINAICSNEDGYHMAIWADGGEVIINGGTFTNVGAGEEDQYDLIYTKNSGKVVINGGKFISETPKWTLNKHDTTESTIIVTGGEFIGYNPAASETENPQANFVAEGYTVTSEVVEGVTVYTVVVAEVQE